jgi:SAM-dependent methyltransferase
MKSEFIPHEIEWTEEKAERLWDYYGSSDAHRSAYFGETAGAHFVRVLKRKGLLRKVRTVVDFSCGTGAIIENLVGFVPRNATVWGFDPSAQSIEKTISRNHAKKCFGGAYQIIGYPTQLETGSIDLLLLTEVIEHLDDHVLDIVLSECRRVLTPGGRLVLCTPNEENLAASNVICPECGSIFHRWQHQRCWSKRSIHDVLSMYGFERIEVQGITWGNELVELLFSILWRRHTGLLAIAEKGR